MAKSIEDLKQLAKSYAVKFEDKGNGHIQLSNHGVLVNYYPLSRNRTVYYNGQTVKHCSNWDAVKLCMQNGVAGLKPKKKVVKKNRAAFCIKPITTNPAGVKHLYSGDIPPWEHPTMISCWSDIYRIEARKLIDAAELIDSPDAYQDCIE